jgi:hypothetical protein
VNQRLRERRQACESESESGSLRMRCGAKGGGRNPLRLGVLGEALPIAEQCSSSQMVQDDQEEEQIDTELGNAERNASAS